MIMNPSPKTKPSFKISFSSSAGRIFVRGSTVPPFSLRTDDTVTFAGYDMSAVRQSGTGTMAYLCRTQTGSRCHHPPLPLHPPHPWSPATQAKTLSHTTDQQLLSPLCCTSLQIPHSRVPQVHKLASLLLGIQSYQRSPVFSLAQVRI